jgi:hypothetical protein
LSDNRLIFLRLWQLIIFRAQKRLKRRKHRSGSCWIWLSLNLTMDTHALSPLLMYRSWWNKWTRQILVISVYCN